MANARRLAITKRYSLQDISDGWNEDCYLSYSPATFQDVKELQALPTDEMTEQDGADRIVEFVKAHVVTGRGLVLNVDGKPELLDLGPDDVEILPPMILSALFAEITGGQLDSPKVTPSAAPSGSAPAGSANPTVTP